MNLLILIQSPLQHSTDLIIVYLHDCIIFSSYGTGLFVRHTSKLSRKMIKFKLEEYNRVR